MSINCVLRVEDIHRSLLLGGQTINILRGISFAVLEGEWVAITGPSGSGKSTLLGILGGIDRPTQGQVVLDGAPVSNMSEASLARVRNQKVGIVFQAFHLIPSMTALENVEAPLYINPRRLKARAIACHMLGEVGLADRLDHLPNQLSGGEQQRVAIARALVNQPRILLADEPTGNLDTATSRQVLTLIGQLRQSYKLTVIMVTHDPNVAEYADRQLRVVDGKLVDPLVPGDQVEITRPVHVSRTAAMPEVAS
jgi:putative ABC transport system ATP-binding protein